MKWGSALESLKRQLQVPEKAQRKAGPVQEDYEYSSLPTSSSEIRIFQLRPAADADIVCGDLVGAPLMKAADNYTALSYHWGSSAKPKAIICDGRRLSVSVSLYCALQRLRKLGFSRIWADAICINQLDYTEKGAQVQMMGQIYKHADRVICDLGEADWEPEAAVELMRIIISSLSNTTAVDPIAVIDFEQYSLPAVQDKIWEVLSALLSLPWFRRLWVMQELVLAENASLLWGMTLFEWDFLYQAIVCLRQYHLESHLSGHMLRADNLFTINQIYSMGGLRIDIRNQRTVTMLDLVYVAQTAEVTDPRDKIYSMLGLTVDASDAALYVSYSEPTAQVYNRVSRRLMEKYGMDKKYGIRALYLSSGPRDGSPSWAIDWNTKIYGGHRPFAGQGWYNTTKDTLHNARVKEEQECLVLVVAGSNFDSIERVTSTSTLSARGLEYSWDRFREWAAEAQTLADDFPIYPTNEPSIHAYALTLVADSRRYPKLEGTTLTDSYKAYITRTRGNENMADILRRAEPFRLRSTAADNRRFCVTRRGYFGLIPPGAEVGDLVTLFMGGDAPVVLRRDESDGRHVYLGDCYIHGIMNGEALQQDDFHVEDFVIK